MSVITFSRYFQTTHPRKGEPTFFVEQILNCVMQRGENGKVDRNDIPAQLYPLINDFVLLDGTMIKSHTIRSGHRFKPGDYFDPRIWYGKPYCSPQIQIAPAIEVKKTWDFQMDERGFYWINGYNTGFDITEVAKNDGLTIDDFNFWFRGSKGFEGQIICWNENIEYV